MYATCVFCTQSLGVNEAIEAFPVGRRLAFDAARGRLWVVCRKCERWNLSPLEERWEAIEECERLFRETRTRVSTEHIGLARLREGLELVRIGEPLRPEFAAWRYGDQFGRRRRNTILYTGAVAVAISGIAIGGAAAGIMSGGVISQSGNIISAIVNRRTLLRLRTADGRVLKLQLPQLQTTRIAPATGGGYTVTIGKRKKLEVFEGREAERVAGLIVPKLNSTGGSRAAVREAVRRLESGGGPEAFLHRTIVAPAQSRGAASSVVHVNFMGMNIAGRSRLEPGTLARLPKPTRLAVEMALHEEQERRALEGELALLEAAWRDAEEVAQIADNLLTPAGADAFIARHRQAAADTASEIDSRDQG